MDWNFRSRKCRRSMSPPSSTMWERSSPTGRSWSSLPRLPGPRNGQFPIGARILAVADAFYAIMSNRPYRKSLPLAHAIAEIRDYVNHHFDPQVARVFFRILRTELNGDRGKVPFLPKEGNGFSPREVLRILDGTLQGLP